MANITWKNDMIQWKTKTQKLAFHKTEVKDKFLYCKVFVHWHWLNQVTFSFFGGLNQLTPVLIVLGSIQLYCNHYTMTMGILHKHTLLYYCMIWLTLKQKCVVEYDVLTGQLWALFTYWCHVCWLRFRRYTSTWTSPVADRSKGRTHWQICCSKVSQIIQ